MFVNNSSLIYSMHIRVLKTFIFFLFNALLAAITRAMFYSISENCS